MAITEGKFWKNKKGDMVHMGNIPDADKLKDSLVEDLLANAIKMSVVLTTFRTDSIKQIEDHFQKLMDEYNIDGKARSKKGNFSLENYSGTQKVEIGVQDRIDFDEKLQIAKAKIDECLHELTKHSPATIKTLITKAFDVDKQGAVNPKKILALKSIDVDHEKWKEAMVIIDESIEIVSSKSYVRFYTRKNTDEAYKLVPLNIAAV